MFKSYTKEVWEQYKGMGVILSAAAAPSHSSLQNNLVLRDGLANEEVCLPRALDFERRAVGKLYCLRRSSCPLVSRHDGGTASFPGH